MTSEPNRLTVRAIENAEKVGLPLVDPDTGVDA